MNTAGSILEKAGPEEVAPFPLYLRDHLDCTYTRLLWIRSAKYL